MWGLHLVGLVSTTIHCAKEIYDKRVSGQAESTLFAFEFHMSEARINDE